MEVEFAPKSSLLTWTECSPLCAECESFVPWREPRAGTGRAKEGFLVVLGSLLALDKQPHIPVYLVKPLTAPHMHAQVWHCFYNIDNNSYSHIFLMRESSHRSKYIWGYWSCKEELQEEQALPSSRYLVDNNSSSPKKSSKWAANGKGEALSIYWLIYL